MDYLRRFVLVGIFSLFLVLLFFFIGASSMYAQEDDYIWPVEGGVLSDTFGSRNGDHDGIDIAAETGTDVKAAKSGDIIRSEYSNSYGNVIMIRHNNKSETVYAHMSKLLKGTGSHVAAGEVIGKVGNTGHSRGSHLHFELHNGAWNPDKTYAANPLPVLSQQENAYVSDKNNRTAEIASFVTAQEKGDEAEFSYTIEKGDTLWDIARTYDTTVEELQETNNISGSLIYPDQEIIIS